MIRRTLCSFCGCLCDDIAVCVVVTRGCQKARPEKALAITMCGGSIKLEATQETFQDQPMRTAQ